MNLEKIGWAQHFKIESEVDLDFVIGQGYGWPVGMQRNSPAQFKRRLLAAMLSYKLQLSSIDYALKRYVKPDTYETEESCLGDEVSKYLRSSFLVLSDELKKLHTQGDLPFGVMGAELTLYRLPHAFDVARMMSNRGLLLETLPVLRLSLEMTAWSHEAFYIRDESKVVGLKAQNCISSLKKTYSSAGQIYGFLSQFSHWGHAIHRQFLDITRESVAVVNASVRYRAMSLALCLVILDVVTEVVRKLYGERSEDLVLKVQGTAGPDSVRQSHQYISKIADITDMPELREIQSFLR